MKGDVHVPKPSNEERALQAEQTELLRAQREILLSTQQQQNALLPVFAESLGLVLKFDETGQIIGAEQTPEARRIEGLSSQLLEKTLGDLLTESPLEKTQNRVLELQLQKLQEELDPTTEEGIRNKEIQKLLGERTLAALKGELPVDPALERDLKKQEETLRDTLRAQLGTGFETSTPGIEAMQSFREGAEVLRSQARRGELTLSEQLASARAGVDIAMGQSVLAGSQARIPGIDPLAAGGFAFGTGQGTVSNQTTLAQLISGQNMGIAGGLGQVAAGFQMPIGQMMAQREMELNASIHNAQNDMMGLGALGSVFGTVLGMIPFSDERLKSDLSQIGEWNGIPIYVYTIGRQRKVGVLAQDLIGIRDKALGQLGEWLLVNYGELV